MNTNRKGKILPRYWALLIMPILPLAAIYWKLQHEKFPYVGTWAGHNYTGDGGSNKMIVAFDGDGGCSWVSDKNLNGKRDILRFPCSYRMNGEKALVTVRLYDAQFVRGKWRFARTAKEQAQAPVVTMVAAHTVTPHQDGKVLLVEAKGAKFVDQKTDQSWPLKYELKESLQRVK